MSSVGFILMTINVGCLGWVANKTFWWSYDWFVERDIRIRIAKKIRSDA